METKIYKQDIMLEAQEIFSKEVKEKMPQALEALEILRTKGYDQKSCIDLYKFVHTLKGSGQTIGLWDIADPAAEIMVVLSLLEGYEVVFTQGLEKFIVERFEEIQDALKGLSSQKKLSLKKLNNINRKKKILVVDDDPSVTKLVQTNLEKEGFKTIVCHSTKSAEHYLKVEQPDLIILDIIFPGENGIDFCYKIRSNHFYQLVPIIFLSVKSKLQDKLAGFATGADDYLCKPFNIEELIVRIKTILNRVEISQDLILKDELTKVYNRRYLGRRLEEEIARSKRSGSKFSLAMIDLNSFKKINDNYGHSTGDEALCCVADRIRESLRTTDIICRYGGDEFIMVLPDTTKSEANIIMERLKKIVSGRPIKVVDEKINIFLTISIGLACYPEDGTTGEELIGVADKAMYRQKI